MTTTNSLSVFNDPFFNMVRIVGYQNEDEKQGQLTYFSENDLISEIKALKSTIEKSGCSLFCIYPNFIFGWLAGPAGYVCSFPSTQAFRCDPFVSNYFRIISLYEVETVPEYIEPQKRRQAHTRIRQCIQEDTKVWPKMESDTDQSGWGESLGVNGGRIGLYTIEEPSLDKQGVNKMRMFIVVQSGLHQKTVKDMHNYDYVLSRKNEALAAKILNITQSSSNKGKIFSYGEEFDSQHSMKIRMLQCASENNNRMAAKFIKILDLVPLNHEIRPSSDTPYVVPDLPDGVPSKERLGKALEYWPRKVPITSLDCLPSYDNPVPTDNNAHVSVKEAIPPDELRGYPIGAYLAHFKKTDLTYFNELVKTYDIVFWSSPWRIIPDLESDTNTMRTDDGQVTWYNGCTPISDRGVIRPLPLSLGYDVINGHLFRGAKAWQNNYLQGYPIDYPFYQSPTPSGTDYHTEAKFISAYHGGISGIKKRGNTIYPSHFHGSYKRISDLTSEMYQDRYTHDLHTQGLTINRLSPLLVYLSQKTPYNAFPTFEDTKSFILPS